MLRSTSAKNTLPFRFGGKCYTGPNKHAFVALGLTEDAWGPEKKWVLLEKARDAVSSGTAP